MPQEPPAESMTRRHTPPGTPPDPDRGAAGTDDSALPNPPGSGSPPGPLSGLPVQKSTPVDPPRHPHDPARSGAAGQIAGDAQHARRLGAALGRMESARSGLEALVPPEGLEDFGQGPTDAEAAERLTEYLAARDQMSDALRAFGPPR